jgi:hypothetical protein
MTTVATKRVDVGEWITRREAVRQMRLQRHLGVAGVAALLIALVSAIPDPLLKLVLISALTLVMLESLARGISAKFGYLWGWPYPEPTEVTRFDILVDEVVHRLATPPASPAPEAKVRLLDPWDDAES